MQKSKKAWGGRFDSSENPLMESFNASIGFDQKLYAEDIQGSIAHAQMLAKQKILSQKEFLKIKKGLEKIKSEIDSGKFTWKIADEDVHMAIESKLTRDIGPAGAKLHSARSRNDQVATDVRLFVKKRLKGIAGLVTDFQKTLVKRADQNGFIPMPGYTHLQRAQPIYLAHHLLAYVEMLERDKGRLNDALKRVDVSPLGAGALAGSTLPIDRKLSAKLMGFADVTQNSLDTVGDRDFIAETLFACSLIMMHLSRLSEELILWSSQEFGFVTLPQGFCTGSSMMPQKVNPDAPELIRGKTGRVYGNLISLLVTLKGLPLAYNKDLQEDKEPLFDSIETVEMCLKVLIAMIPGIQFHAGKMKNACKDGFLLATDVAEYLVTKGVEFRHAHEVVGTAVRYCIENNMTLEELSLKEWKAMSPKFEGDIQKWLDVNSSINKRNSLGGTAKKQIVSQIIRWKKVL